MLLDLAVTDRDGRRISFKGALGRHFGKYISGALLAQALTGLYLPATTTSKQYLGMQLTKKENCEKAHEAVPCQ